jgi:hypothetical protein
VSTGRKFSITHDRIVETLKFGEDPSEFIQSIDVVLAEDIEPDDDV